MIWNAAERKIQDVSNINDNKHKKSKNDTQKLIAKLYNKIKIYKNFILTFFFYKMAIKIVSLKIKN